MFTLKAGGHGTGHGVTYRKVTKGGVVESDRDLAAAEPLRYEPYHGDPPADLVAYKERVAAHLARVAAAAAAERGEAPEAPDAPAKRGRGRPPKAHADGGETPAFDGGGEE